jgi:hypothetical protein
MATEFIKEWAVTYNKATAVFSKDMNAANKVDRQYGGWLKRVLEPVQSCAALGSAMEAIDKISLDATTPTQIAALPGNIKLYKAALPKFESEKKKFVADAEEILRLKPSVPDKNGYAVPTPFKDAYADSYRQLKIMQTDVQAFFARAQNALASAENKEKSNKIEADKLKAKSKVTGADDAANDKLKQISEEAAMKQFQLVFAPAFKSGMAKGAAVIQKIKASPTVATYNDEMNSGGRDISQQLVNITKLKAHPKFKDSSLAKKLPAPGALANEIVPFANGNLRQLATTATPADVTNALAQFTNLYKRIATTYQDVIAGKLK